MTADETLEWLDAALTNCQTGKGRLFVIRETARRFAVLGLDTRPVHELVAKYPATKQHPVTIRDIDEAISKGVESFKRHCPLPLGKIVG